MDRPLHLLQLGFPTTTMRREGNEAVIPGSGDSIGVGALSPGVHNVGGPQKINIQASVNGLTRMVHWLFTWCAASKPHPMTSMASPWIPRRRGGRDRRHRCGAEGSPLSGRLWYERRSERVAQKTIRVTDPAGQTVTRQVNTGYDLMRPSFRGHAQRARPTR